MNISREFGPGLKALRERRGVTLEAIATATKIGRPLLEGLERNDVSHWPKGIFRRAFFRDYAASIGAPVDDTLAEFLRLFPEYDSGPSVSESPTPFRMTFEPGRSRAWKRTMRVGAALLEASAVTAIGLAAAWCLGVESVNAVAFAVLIYYPLTSAWLGRGLALSWLNDGQRIPAAWRTARPGARQPTAPAHTLAEPLREVRQTAGSQRDHRSGVDSGVAVGVDESEPEPVARLLRLRKGSAA